MHSGTKRLLSMLMALIMVFSMITPVSASAASTTASNDAKEIEVGETTKLEVPGVYARITWTSSDNGIAEVSSNGTVTGVAPGTATITASYRIYFGFWGRNKTTTFTVVVTEPETQDVTVEEGKTLQLSVNAKGGKVTWKSSNKRIATVDNNGLVKGIQEGNVTITATITKSTSHRFPWQRPGKPTTEVIKFEVTVLPEAPAVNYFTVTFNSNGGSEVAAQTVEEGMTAVEPEAPTLDGYTFVGWYADEELTQEYNFAAAVTADITLYAKWEENEPPRPTMPENPSAADEYIWSTSDVVDVIPAEESEDVPTEVEVIDLLTERGFDSYPVVYEHTINGDYVEETEISAGTTDKHPMYYTYYVSANRELWLIYVVNGMVMANPVSFNLQSALPAELVVSESEALTSYDDVGNQFYVNIPYESAVIVKTVGRIDAETLDGLTIEEINKL